MTLFKLVFEHDMVLNPVESAEKRGAPSSLEDFLKPIQTYSMFYFSATDMQHMHFGLNAVAEGNKLIGSLETGLGASGFLLSNGARVETLTDALAQTNQGGAIVVIKNETVVEPFKDMEEGESFRDRIPELRQLLDKGHLLILKIPAHHGFDIQLYSRENIYRSFFYQFKPMISNEFRFFSINGKKMKSERFLYFETWSLQRPPHGFEEVFEDTAFY